MVKTKQQIKTFKHKRHASLTLAVMARKPSRSTPEDDEKEYQPARIRSTATSNRIGPIPAEECKVRGRRERPGQLAVKNKKQDSSTQRNAGSLALLEYFYRFNHNSLYFITGLSCFYEPSSS